MTDRAQELEMLAETHPDEPVNVRSLTIINANARFIIL
jgi:hypothetical protein